MPVLLSDGTFYGTLCALDPEPRELARHQADMLVVLARLLATQIERDHELARRKLAEEEREARARQQAVAANLGQQALAWPDLYELMDAVVGCIAMTLGVEYCNVLELLPEGDALLLRAGVGWKEGLVGSATVGAGLDSQAGYAFVSSGPVIVRDLRAETRFHAPPLMLDHGVVSGMSVVIEGRDRPYGVLGAHTSSEREFTEDDINFLETVANVLATAIERQVLEKRLAEDRFRSLVQNSSDVFGVIGADAVVRYISPSVERILGYTPEEKIGRSVLDATLIHPDDLEVARSAFARILTSPDGSGSAEVRVLHKDGAWRYIEAVGNNRINDPSINGIVVNYRDITERKRLEEQLRHQAFHDPLTGLPNGALFMDRLEHALARASGRAESLAVLYLDLDRFKLVNDSLGHKAGDELLSVVARRLRGCLRPMDTAARLGGDEFAILLEDIVAEAEARVMAERVGNELQRCFEIAGREVVITGSIGIALSTFGREAPEELLRAADVALHRAKSTGKARHEMFNPDMGYKASGRVEIEVDLRRAIEREEFRLYYQPMVELATGRLLGVEALLRWEHPQKGLVTPTEFIPIAEETGLILPLEGWALREACRQAGLWRERHPSRAWFSVSVNLSAKHFQHPYLLEEVAEVLQDTGMNPRCLVIEITESILMDDAESHVATLCELKGLGVQIAIDDFGTGYSSLGYLHRFPVDILKIDRTFVDGLVRESEDAAIVRAVISLAGALRLKVFAEGVQTREQVERLRSLGCELGQGYFFSRP